MLVSPTFRREQCRVFELALAHTNKPLSIAEECLLHRDKRIGIDLVKDAVERALIKVSQH
ncbi:unnamed protein product [Protopolystoma xenopodis]|uniref:Uncharacterized protein n=1 Tax=Protopolystoma xenopodis TaxID=117903 RepID=A0A448WR67_9PLAT|nr:unnamed protein product [Protopolystoma xenopodis]